MSTPVMLVDDLVSFVKEIIAERQMQSRNESMTTIEVHDDELPAKKPNETDYPCVIVRFLYQEGNIARVDIIGGAYNQDGKGWRDVLNILTPIKQGLEKTPSVYRKHRLSKAKPLRLVLPAEQAKPQYLAAIETYWELPNVVLEPELINSEMERFLNGK